MNATNIIPGTGNITFPDPTTWPEHARRCPRCLGTGRYSFNLKDLDMCYGCMGREYVLPGDRYYRFTGAKAPRFAIRGIGASFYTNDHTQILPFIKKACEAANVHWHENKDMTVKVIDWKADQVVGYQRDDQGVWKKAFDTLSPAPDRCNDCDDPLTTEEEKREGFCWVCLLVIADKARQAAATKPEPIQQQEKNKMYWAGVVNSEETMRGNLPDGRTVYVEWFKYEMAPEHLRDNPEYWAERVESGEFHDEENPPIAWIEEAAPVASSYYPGPVCKECGKPVDVTIEGEIICGQCWSRGQMSDEEIANNEEIEYMLTHCNSNNCDTLLKTEREKKELFCQKCLNEMAVEAAEIEAEIAAIPDPFKKCEDCGYPVDDDSKYCDSCHERQHKEYWDTRNKEVKQEIETKQAQLAKVKKANPDHDSICARFDCPVCETMRVLTREIEALGHEWVHIDNELKAYY